MNINTKFETGNKVWFHDKGKIYRGKIFHVTIDLNGGKYIKYDLERTDKDWEHYSRRSPIRFCYEACCDKTPRRTFYEGELSESKEGLIKNLKRLENERHETKIEEILGLG